MKINKIYALNKQDGTVGITYVGDGHTIEEEISKMNATCQAEIVSFKEIKQTDIPQSREFRNAWRHDGEKIYHDAERARDISLAAIRIKREEKFKELGMPYQLAPELEDAVLSTETKAKLKELRDSTNPLKAMEVKGKKADEKLLEELKTYL